MFFESLALNVIVLLVLLGALLFDYITKFFTYWYVRHVSYKRPIPCFGSDLERVLGLRGTTEAVNNLCQQYPKEKLIGYIKGRLPDLIVKDPDIIKLVLSTDFAYFHKKGLCLEKSPDICIRNSLFYAEDKKWTALREQIAESLRDCPSWKDVCNNISMEHMKEDAGKININDFLGIIMDKIMVNNVIRSKNIDNFVTNLRKSLQKPSIIDTFKDYVKTIYPSMYNLFGMTTFPMHLLRNGREVADTLENNNLLNHIAKKSKTDNAKKADSIISTVCAIINEAYIPCYNVTISVLYELANSQTIQKKAREAVKLAKIDDVPNKHESDYLDNIIQEAMRLYPPYSIINRNCVKTYKLPNPDILIDKGITITIPVEAIHRDSDYYNEPEKFDPNRFSAQVQENRHSYAYIPFGSGPRKCPGAELAHNVIRGVVSTVLEHYELETCPETPKRLVYRDYDFKRILAYDVWLNMSPLPRTVE